jgi:hypothetical protein
MSEVNRETEREEQRRIYYKKFFKNKMESILDISGKPCYS